MATGRWNGYRSFRHRTNSAAKGESSPNWLELPPEVTAVILQKLGAIDTLKNAQKVCSQWRSICKEPATWSTIDMRNSGFAFNVFEKLAVIFRDAVDRSCGGVVDLNIEYFGNDELLGYVTQRYCLFLVGVALIYSSSSVDNCSFDQLLCMFCC